MPNVIARPRTLENGRTLTQFTDTTSTSTVTYTYPAQQTSLQIENSGEKDITVTVGSYMQTVKADTKWKVDTSFTSFTISSAVDSQEFIATTFIDVVTDLNVISSQLAENTKKQLVKSNVYPDKTADYTTQTSTWEVSLITNPNTFYSKVQSAGGALNNYFRYNIRMQEAGSTYPLYLAVGSVTSTVSQTSDFTVEFMTDATQMEIMFRNTSNWVHVIADNEIVAKLTLSTDRTLITFPTKKPRHIKLLCQSNSRFSGITVDTRSIVWRCHESRKKLIIDGDSIAWGANNLGQGLNSPVGIISQMFDWDFYVNAMGGTGYVADSSGTSVPIIQRLNGIVDEKPDVILILNGLNDCSATYLLTLEAKVNEYLTALKTNFPTKDIIITSPFNPKSDLTSVAYIQEVEAVIRARALAYKLPYIDLLRGNTYDKNGNLITSSQGGIITGTGSVANVQPTGNASIYMSSDTTHTSPEGGRYLGFRIAEEIYKILKS